MVKGILLAMQFLTIIPVRVRGAITEDLVARSGIFFPVIGAIQGLVAALAAFVLVQVFPADLVSGLIVFLLILTNGAFHLDALADTFDGLAVKSTGERMADRQKRLSIMKESTTGAIGVAAIVMSILLKYLFIGALFQRYDPTPTACLLFFMPLFSRWVMIPVMAQGTSARQAGLGKMFVDKTGSRSVLLSSLLLLLIYFGATTISGAFTFIAAIKLLSVSAFTLYAFAILWAFFCRRKFGGLTGDTIGAAGEIGDLWFLVVALLLF